MKKNVNLGGANVKANKKLSMKIKRAASLGLVLGLLAANGNVVGATQLTATDDTEKDNIAVEDNAADTTDLTDEGVSLDESTDENADVDEIADETEETSKDATNTTTAADADDTDTTDETATEATPTTTAESNAEATTTTATAISTDYTIKYFANTGAAPDVTYDEETGEAIVEEIQPIAEISYEFDAAALAADLDVISETLDATIEKDGYVFIGWAADETATEPDFEAGDELPANENLTLYGVWILESEAGFYVTYYGNGSTFGNLPEHTDEGAFPFGSEVNLRYPWGLEKDGFEFAGWSRDPFATEPEFTFDDAYHSAADVTKTLRLYAVWTPVE